eukprot:540917-Amphidinium_carterae.1
MLLETNVGASLKAPEAEAGTPADDPMDTSALWKGKGKGNGKDKGNQKGCFEGLRLFGHGAVTE